jgi:ABC-2 type transport system permease protein
VLTRLAVTPVSPTLVIATQILTYVLFGLVNGVLVLVVGTLVGVGFTITADVVWALALIGVVVLTALAFAFAIAGFMPHPAGATAVSGALGMPLWFLSGATYPIAALPGVLPDVVVWAVPFAAPIQAIRGILVEGASITAYGTHVLIGAGWLVLAFGLAAAGYRFTRE